MTFLELSVVIIVMLSLVAILFVGTRAWRRGSDKTLCIIHIQNMQKGVRGYANMHGLAPGDSVVGLQAQVIGAGKFFEHAPQCPASGSYAYGQVHGVDTIPPIGELYLRCSLGVSNGHAPTSTEEW